VAIGGTINQHVRRPPGNTKDAATAQQGRPDSDEREMMTESVTKEEESTMTVEERIEVLKEKHASLESALAEENSRPLPDTGALAHIKREKLAIKDELERLTHG